MPYTRRCSQRIGVRVTVHARQRPHVQSMSVPGAWMQRVAQSWLVYRMTRSAALLGLVAFAGQIPVFICAPIGGAAADRVNRHRIIIWTQTISMVLAFILAGLTLSGA